MLQWGRAHVSAESYRQRKTASPAGGKLQWGRAHVSAERCCSGSSRPTRLGASMGPRSRERGKLPAASRRARRAGMLQWGRAHVSAERRPFAVRHGGLKSSLQWGRAHVSAERARTVSPRPCVGVASMGPRSRERGKHLGPRGRLYRFLLQWGRAHVSAESARRRPPRKKLQWGRAHVSAESSASTRTRSIGDASMGPRSRERGKRVMRRRRRVTYGASMGPRSRERGRAARLVDGFNGAALT